MQYPYLDLWYACTTYPFSAPEATVGRISGCVFHSKFEPGSHITVSPIVGICGDLVRSRTGTIYRLGRILPDYEKQFPNALERMQRVLPAFEILDEEVRLHDSPQIESVAFTNACREFKQLQEQGTQLRKGQFLYDYFKLYRMNRDPYSSLYELKGEKAVAYFKQHFTFN